MLLFLGAIRFSTYNPFLYMSIETRHWLHISDLIRSSIFRFSYRGSDNKVYVPFRICSKQKKLPSDFRQCHSLWLNLKYLKYIVRPKDGRYLSYMFISQECVLLNWEPNKPN